MIVLISPPKMSSHSSSFFVGRSGLPPISIAYLGSALKKNNIEYSVIDGLAKKERFHTPKEDIYCEGMSFEEILIQIPIDAILVGISAMFTTEFKIVRELCAYIKERLPNIKIVLGGEHASSMAIPTLKYEPSVDYIVYGEGEDSLVALYFALEQKLDLEEVGGIYYRLGVDIKKTQPRPRITLLDDHFPDWSKIPVDFYLDQKISTTKLGVRTLPIISTRGCPYKCTFCSADSMWGARYVMRSIESIVKEIEYDIETYAIEHFEFQDLSTSVNKKWFKELLEALIHNFPHISWEMAVGTRSEILDREILSLLKQSGTTKITYAPETGSVELSKKIKKRLDHKKLYISIRHALDLGMEVKTSTIIGFPEESILDLMKTFLMVIKLGLLGVKNVVIFIFAAYPGSELFDKTYDTNNLTRSEYEEILNYQSNNSPGGRVFNPFLILKYPREQLYTFVANSMMLFAYSISVLRNPRYLGSLIKNLKKGSPQGPIEIGLHLVLKKLRLT
ncbi:MAG: B12-binding domain-containing radical SAM protein [Bacteriovoracaceae bacterium]|nr:B12-binding domain-containing radical SAM protein [Bacteriovoracaceae bacterium]